ncbi:PAS domain-containing sensor histidine kinase [Peribacillus huizhouensis]|uniref:histidine kinase n=1 Tax=Peribacillus huizhouensis TaxID=1501239 RepID=A0ABR6CPP6_9BACI|nr:PAS domain-containing sensor histidine kinase [Peribacillus huizhouensis]MBA9026676.1 PAS domain S-box-containing protein [Peribacillus huizhouensis]
MPKLFVYIHVICCLSILLLIEWYLTITNLPFHKLMIIQRIEGILFIIITTVILYFFLKKRKSYTLLKEEQERLQTLIHSMADFVNFKDGQGRWTEVNKFGLELFQLEQVNYKGKKDSELAQYTDFYKEALEYCETSDEETWVSRQVTRCEEIIPMPDGDHKTFDTIKVPLFHEDGSRRAFVVIGRDITERVKAEQHLLQSQQQYKSLFDYNPDPLLMMDIHGIISNTNPRFKGITCWGFDDIIGVSIMDILANSNDKESFQKSFTDVIETRTGITHGDISILTKHEETVILYFTLVPMLINDQIVGVIGYAQDVTLMRETEEMLRKTEKLSVVGELAASVAHEVRNPLTSLTGFVQLLKSNEIEYQHYYSIMLSELDRINLIVSELLVLAKPQKINFSDHNIVMLMNDVVTLLKPEANLNGASISIKEHEPIPAIRCEANQLKQVFINIIKNSIEASATSVSIEFSTKRDQVTVKIKDNGHGVGKARIQHLGEPFYSSKEKGTGLGLTVSSRIIETHRGNISFDSTLGRGTEVLLSLPINCHSQQSTG